jgi:hypothetical protein
MKQHRNILSRAGIYIFTIVLIYAACLSVFEVTLAQGISGVLSAAQQISLQKPGTVPAGIRNLNTPVDDGKIMNVMSHTGQGMYIGTIRVSSSRNPGNYSDYRIMVMNTTITVTISPPYIAITSPQKIVNM